MITSDNRTDLFYGSQRITSRYLGNRLIWEENLDAQSTTSGNVFTYHTAQPFSLYDYSTAQVKLASSDVQLIREKT